MDAALKKQMSDAIASEHKAKSYWYYLHQRSRGQQKIFYGLLLSLISLVHKMYYAPSSSTAMWRKKAALTSEHIQLCVLSTALFRHFDKTNIDQIWASVESLKEAKRRDAAREMIKTIRTHQSSINSSTGDMCKLLPFQKFAGALQTSFDDVKDQFGVILKTSEEQSDTNSRAIAAYLFFMEKFYKQILDFSYSPR